MMMRIFGVRLLTEEEACTRKEVGQAGEPFFDLPCLPNTCVSATIVAMLPAYVMLGIAKVIVIKGDGRGGNNHNAGCVLHSRRFFIEAAHGWFVSC